MTYSTLTASEVLPFIGKLQEQTTLIVSAYVSRNSVPVADLPKLITDTHAAVMATMMTLPGLGDTSLKSKATPAQIKASITHDHLISFEDGKPYKTLKRHLTVLGLSPQDYRAKHGLPKDYPMVSAGYSDKRSQLAVSLGLGRKRPANTIAA